MRIGLLLLCLYGLSSAAHASTLIDIGSSICSGSQSSDFTNGLSFSCSGDFSLSTGSVSSDTSISVSALGSLSLDAFTLSAPNITLNATSIHIGPNSTLNGQNIHLFANNLVYDGLTSADATIQSSDATIQISPRPDISISEPVRLEPRIMTILPGRDIVPPDQPIIGSLNGSLTVLSSGNISVPLPASFTMLLTGLLPLLSASGRSLFRKA